MIETIKSLSPDDVTRLVAQTRERMGNKMCCRDVWLPFEQEDDDFVDPICRQDAMVQRRNHNYGEE